LNYYLRKIYVKLNVKLDQSYGTRNPVIASKTVAVKVASADSNYRSAVNSQSNINDGDDDDAHFLRAIHSVNVIKVID